MTENVLNIYLHIHAHTYKHAHVIFNIFELNFRLFIIIAFSQLGSKMEKYFQGCSQGRREVLKFQNLENNYVV